MIDPNYKWNDVEKVLIDAFQGIRPLDPDQQAAHKTIYYDKQTKTLRALSKEETAATQKDGSQKSKNLEKLQLNDLITFVETTWQRKTKAEKSSNPERTQQILGYMSGRKLKQYEGITGTIRQFFSALQNLFSRLFTFSTSAGRAKAMADKLLPEIQAKNTAEIDRTRLDTIPEGHESKEKDDQYQSNSTGAAQKALSSAEQRKSSAAVTPKTTAAVLKSDASSKTKKAEEKAKKEYAETTEHNLQTLPGYTMFEKLGDFIYTDIQHLELQSQINSLFGQIQNLNTRFTAAEKENKVVNELFAETGEGSKIKMSKDSFGGYKIKLSFPKSLFLLDKISDVNTLLYKETTAHNERIKQKQAAIEKSKHELDKYEANYSEQDLKSLSESSRKKNDEFDDAINQILAKINSFQPLLKKAGSSASVDIEAPSKMLIFLTKNQTNYSLTIQDTSDNIAVKKVIAAFKRYVDSEWKRSTKS